MRLNKAAIKYAITENTLKVPNLKIIIPDADIPRTFPTLYTPLLFASINAIICIIKDTIAKIIAIIWIIDEL